MTFFENIEFDENMTVGELKNEMNEIRKSPILFFQLALNGQLLMDRNQTMKQLGINDFAQITLISTQAADPDNQ